MKKINVIIPVLVAGGVGFALGYSMSVRETTDIPPDQLTQEEGNTSIESSRFVPRPNFSPVQEDGSGISVASEDGLSFLERARLKAQRRREEKIAQLFEQRVPEYQRVFAELGVTPDRAEALMDKLREIKQASVDCQIAMQALMRSRNKYKEMAASSMSPEDAERYREYEESKPAVRELGIFKEYLTLQNSTIDPAHEDIIFNVIREAEAYTAFSWDGPYDGLPRGAEGAEAVSELLETHIKEYTQHSEVVHQRAIESGLPIETAKTLTDYYDSRIQETRQLLEQNRDFEKNRPQIMEDEANKLRERQARLDEQQKARAERAADIAPTAE